MAAQNKIERYGLEERVLSLIADGKTTVQIAQILNETDLAARGDSISQPSVSRWLKDIRRERSEQTRQVVHDHIKRTVPKDMEALDEIEAWLLDKFRVLDDTRLRADLGMRVVKIVETKLRFAGILEDPDSPAGRGMHLPDLEQYRAAAASASPGNGNARTSASCGGGYEDTVYE